MLVGEAEYCHDTRNAVAVITGSDRISVATFGVSWAVEGETRGCLIET